MAEIERAVREERARISDQFDVSPHEINAGMCDLLAERVADRVPGAELCNTSTVFREPRDYPGHVWVYHQGRHYDAECPDGTACFLDLPFFERHREALEEAGLHGCIRSGRLTATASRRLSGRVSGGD